MKHLLFSILLLCLTLNVPAIALAGQSGPQSKDIQITLPAEAILESLQSMIPIPVSTGKTDIKGQIFITSITSLGINNNIFSLKGIVQGNNLSMVTSIAGQDIRLKLGEVNLPVACDLKTRFDAARQILYVTPTFPTESTSPESASIQPLFTAMGGKEYPITMNTLNLSNLSIGDRPIPLTMAPVKISGHNNILTLNLRPQRQKQ